MDLLSLKHRHQIMSTCYDVKVVRLLFLCFLRFTQYETAAITGTERNNRLKKSPGYQPGLNMSLLADYFSTLSWSQEVKTLDKVHQCVYCPHAGVSVTSALLSGLKPDAEDWVEMRER